VCNLTEWLQRRALAFLFLLGLGTAFQIAQASADAPLPQPQSAPAEDLKFSVLVEKTEYKLSDPIEVSFQLENKGAKPVYVNKRFKVSSKNAPREQREVFLEAYDPSGKELESKYMDYKTGLPKSEYLELLQSNQKIASESKLDLKNHFDFKEPGTYRIVATYENTFGPELGLDTFQEKRLSEVTLKIVG